MAGLTSLVRDGTACNDESRGWADVVVAVIENRAKEVGIAEFDGRKVSLRLFQFVGSAFLSQDSLFL